MSARFTDLISKHRNGSLLVDSNLLLLFFVGDVNKSYIKKFDRTSRYDVSDQESVAAVMTAFATRIVTTPYILTEVSNLANKLSGGRRSEFFVRFAYWIPLLSEETSASSEICSHDQFEVFGLTDLGILHYARGNHLVLTDDGRLSSYLRTNGVDVVTLSDLRAVGSGPS